MAINFINKEEWNTLISNTNGAVFCQVDKIKQLNHVKLVIIEGYQKWKGASPNFINKLKVKINIIISLLGVKSHSNILEINIKFEPNAWTKKYLIDPSISFELLA